MIKFLGTLIGFFSLIFIPYFYGIKIIDFWLVITLFLLLMLVLRKNKISFISVLVISTIGTFLIITILGAVLNTISYKGVFVSIKYMIVLIVVALFGYIDKNFLLYFKRGFLISSYVTVIWMIIDEIYYYTHSFISINEVVFSNLYLGNEHALTNRLEILNLPLLLRASGFGWDPSGIGPALLIAFIINYYSKLFKYNWVLILGILLSLSKTAIFALLLFLVYALLEKLNKRLPIFFTIAFFVMIFIFSALKNGNSVSFDKDGVIRHIKYPSSIIFVIEAPLSEILFGYGYRGTGEFFSKYPPWFKTHDFMENIYEARNKVIESTFTNLFLYGGIIGAIIYFGVILFIFFSGNKEERAVIVFLMITFVGYTCENVWTNFLIYGIFFQLLKRKYASTFRRPKLSMQLR